MSTSGRGGDPSGGLPRSRGRRQSNSARTGARCAASNGRGLGAIVDGQPADGEESGASVPPRRGLGSPGRARKRAAAATGRWRGARRRSASGGRGARRGTRRGWRPSRGGPASQALRPAERPGERPAEGCYDCTARESAMPSSMAACCPCAQCEDPPVRRPRWADGATVACVLASCAVAGAVQGAVAAVFRGGLFWISSRSFSSRSRSPFRSRRFCL